MIEGAERRLRVAEVAVDHRYGDADIDRALELLSTFARGTCYPSIPSQG